MIYSQTLTDRELIRLFQSGETNALEKLVHRYKDGTYTFILSLVKERHTAEDIFQDLFIKLFESLRQGKYKEAGRFQPWLMQLAYRLCMDYFRKTKRGQKWQDKYLQEQDCPSLFMSQPSDMGIIRREISEQVRKALDKLPREQLEVILLRHYGNIPFRTIAEMTGCSINTALGRMRYGLQNMQKMMVEK